MTALNVTKAARSLPWWVYLVTGAAWIIVSWLVLGFNSSSVVAIATLAGLVILAAALTEFLMVIYAPGWKWLHAILGVLFVVTGIFCLINPGRTFFWLAAFVGWYLLFKGAADIMLAFLTKRENEAWWLGLIVGIVEVLLGFWAAGRFDRSAYTLVVLVAAIALARGITDIIMAFRVRKHGEIEIDEVDVTPAPVTAPAAAPAADPGRATTPEAQVPNGTPESANLRGGGPSDR
jgi:uncharacterized membrane protein HdeD (DUF308 family)